MTFLYYTFLPTQPFPCIHRSGLGSWLSIVLIQTFSIASPRSPAGSARQEGWRPGSPQRGVPARAAALLRSKTLRTCCGSRDAPTPRSPSRAPLPRGAAAPSIVHRLQTIARGRRSTQESHSRRGVRAAPRALHPPTPAQRPPRSAKRRPRGSGDANRRHAPPRPYSPLRRLPQRGAARARSAPRRSAGLGAPEPAVLAWPGLPAAACALLRPRRGRERGREGSTIPPPSSSSPRPGGGFTHPLCVELRSPQRGRRERGGVVFPAPDCGHHPKRCPGALRRTADSQYRGRSRHPFRAGR